ncbi:MAG: 3-deoxy-manno-octulosonate cytidylyltransferase [Rickettsiaceae bacterium]|jgi:3-deoxy-manno-octulosonate cytidylyltransferase (CMP-KDO synthetase)|nr:3-deoxy-manno-octulosonate cytidylyltransferase [Rickettsiaceae bacterium]
MSVKVAVFIPARMASTRLPNKPLADIAGKPMIIHVWERSCLAAVDDVYVACAEQEIADKVEKCGGKAILTNPSHPSGTDRIYEALQKTGKNYDFIVNVQGDLPTLDHKIIDKALKLMENPAVDIATLVAVIKKPEERTNPNVVKAVLAESGQALYFSRATAPYGDGDLFHHIGLYVYRRQSLEKFVKLPPSPLEKREKLEQLRALENGMRIDAAVVDTVPLGVDTPEDLEVVRNLVESGI